MEAMLVLLGIAYLLCPIIALLIALTARRKAIDLQNEVRELKARLAQGAFAARVPSEAEAPVYAPAPHQAPPEPTEAIEPLPEKSAPAAPVASTEPATAEAAVPAQPEQVPQPRTPGMAETWIAKAKEWLFGGNLVAKAGLLILFLGVSFLLKFAAAHVTVPIELRLAGIALADIALLIWGWRIRERRAAIGLPVQGAALAILMMVTFGAFKLYHLLPAGFAFALLFALTAFTCLLAVLQDALWLAVFGIAGGFAAPILTSTGEGSHVALFSYYALLNAGVLGIALKRSWRVLNLIGFVFTFLIGTAWGVLQYRPEHYLSAQMFLLLFFAFYVGIAVVYALREAPRLRHYVDGTLVFGTPLVAFGLQYGLVRHVQFGLALSALALGLFYMLLAAALWRRRGEGLRLLLESFFALAVVFGTLAIPFALDGRWTSAAWALEGAGIVWIGLRQRQTLAWMFGLLVQAGAWISFLFSISGLDPLSAAQSNLWLGFLLLAATAFLMAANFRTHANQAEAGHGYLFGPVATAFLALAAIWFVAGAWTEIWLRLHGAAQANLLVMSALLAALMLGVIAKRMQWQAARYFALAVQALAGVTLLVLAAWRLNWPFEPVPANLFAGPFLGALLIGGGAAFSAWVFQRQAESAGEPRMLMLSRGLLAWCGLWWFGLILHNLAGWAATHWLIFSQRPETDRLDLWINAYAIGLALSGPALAHLARRLRWSDLRWASVANWLALGLDGIALLASLYLIDILPKADVWLAYLALWLSAEWLMRAWRDAAWPMRDGALKLLHCVRTIGPWLMIWPLGRHWIAAWLYGGTEAEQRMLEQAGWFTSGSWARYLPAWAMMLAIAWLMQRSRSGGWPTHPIAAWYRTRLIPLACAWAILLVALWNLTQNGSMSPLPYLPLLNPLDLSSGFALLLAVAAYRLARPDLTPNAWLAKLPLAAGVAAYLWFNLMLLRSASHFLGIRYQVDALFGSQFVQAMLALVWSATALLLMRRAVTHAARQQWMLGAALLALVVVKLFLVDLSNVGGVARIISFVGVGLLMLAIGYLAPYPSQPSNPAPPDHV